MAVYFTTPLYYVNDTPHIGHAYTTIIADVLRRYRRMYGEETLFLTGTDEHGQKVQTAAHKRGLTPQAHCDEMVLNFQNIWKELNIDYDIFYRTTAPSHVKAVQACLQDLYDRDEIYTKEFTGWYSVSDEIFYTEKDLVGGKAPTGGEVSLVTEKNYFFKMSKYQEQLISHIEKNPGFIAPESKQNEVLGFLRKPLQDLCISRPKARMSWGIEMPFDKDYVTYVWFDALLNYAVAVGFKVPNQETQFVKWWSPESCGATHLIGKDILTTHAVYWTTMLMGLRAPLPKQIFAHGWWLTDTNEKMSKSKGPTIKPLDMKDLVGVDGLRYFLTRDIHLGNDAQFSQDLVIARVNTDLANNFGNLLSRSTNLIEKFFEGTIPIVEIQMPSSLDLAKQALALVDIVHREILAMAPNRAIEAVTDMLSLANKYMETHAPWKSLKAAAGDTGLMREGAESLFVCLECLRFAGILLSPVMPTKMSELLKLIGWEKSPNLLDLKTFQRIKAGTHIGKAAPLFPRI